MTSRSNSPEQDQAIRVFRHLGLPLVEVERDVNWVTFEVGHQRLRITIGIDGRITDE